MQALRDGVQDVAVKVLAASQVSSIAQGTQLQILKKVSCFGPTPPQLVMLAHHKLKSMVTLNLLPSL